MNNNNFGRANVPSNMTPQFNGNPFANFNPLTTNYPMFPTFNNVDNAYRQNSPFINKIDHSNQNNTLHNNLGDNLLNENIVEYRINIDSSDRDPKVFKDPFSYTVTFNPTRSTARPIIEREFKNVKYIKLESVILPRYMHIEDTGSEYELSTDSDSHLYDDRFVILNIEQLEGIESRVYGTNTHLTNSFAQITPDKLISSNYYTGIPYLGTRYFKDSHLENLKKLTIRFLDSYGNPLKIQEVSSSGGSLSIVDSDPLAVKQDDGTFKDKNDTTIDITDVRHPMNRSFQNHISLVIGVVEAELNTDTQYTS